ncbi:hypothetical protein TRIUR3_20146 [Triticum urartu]|uniref:Uncharacterized protein n=1 Tax=Triticum urartu TaxID=4572 RepID=M7YWF6_TRIUA|nr:hypothetical protein TRIUR3_20146 [Triticum urartu]
MVELEDGVPDFINEAESVTMSWNKVLLAWSLSLWLRQASGVLAPRSNACEEMIVWHASPSCSDEETLDPPCFRPRDFKIQKRRKEVAGRCPSSPLCQWPRKERERRREEPSPPSQVTEDVISDILPSLTPKYALRSRAVCERLALAPARRRPLDPPCSLLLSYCEAPKPARLSNCFELELEAVGLTTDKRRLVVRFIGGRPRLQSPRGAASCDGILSVLDAFFVCKPATRRYAPLPPPRGPWECRVGSCAAETNTAGSHRPSQLARGIERAVVCTGLLEWTRWRRWSARACTNPPGPSLYTARQPAVLHCTGRQADNILAGVGQSTQLLIPGSWSWRSTMQCHALP